MSGRLDSLAWWSGEFRDPAVESAFRASRERAELRQLRLVWLVALGFFGVYGLLEQWAARPEPEAGPWRAVILATGILPRGTEAPRMVTPPDDFDRAFLTDLVESGARDLDRQAEAVTALFDEPWTIPHQTLGPLTAEAWVRFARMHGVHHWRIVREVLAAGTPS